MAWWNPGTWVREFNDLRKGWRKVGKCWRWRAALRERRQRAQQQERERQRQQQQSVADSQREEAKKEGARGYLQFLHEESFHSLRRTVGAIGHHGTHDRWVVLQIIDLCTKIRNAMAAALELDNPKNDLDCCVKLVVPRAFVESKSHRGTEVRDAAAGELRDSQDPTPAANARDDYIATGGRSEPYTHRVNSLWPEDPQPVRENTVFAALLGVFDGATKWPDGGHNCFCCSDLTEKYDAGEFRCSRDKFQQYYRSALVFPMRRALYADDGEGYEHLDTIGFLAFDSRRTDVFKGFPCIFDYKQDPQAYRQALQGYLCFHLGAVLADTLGTGLGATRMFLPDHQTAG